MKVGYRLVRNATSTADKAPYLGVAVPVGSLAYDNILARMLDRGTHMTRATAQYFLNAFYEYAAETIAEDVVRINMGAVAVYPMIGGSFDSEDDEFREPRNSLYVGATLSQDIRDAVSGIVPANLGAEAANGTVAITSVMDLASEEYRLIDGLKEFRIVGIDLTVPDGEDESLALVESDGATQAADIAVVSTEDGQRIKCVLASAGPKGTYYVRLVSHGLDPTAPLTTVLHKVAVKEGEPVPAPLAVSRLKSTMFEADDTTWFQHDDTAEADAFNTVTGTGFGDDLAARIVLKDAEGQVAATAEVSDLKRTSATEFTFKLFEPQSRPPDGDWEDGPVFLEVTGGGETVEFPVAFVHPASN